MSRDAAEGHASLVVEMWIDSAQRLREDLIEDLWWAAVHIGAGKGMAMCMHACAHLWAPGYVQN
jgi:hypothetical protein